MRHLLKRDALEQVRTHRLLIAVLAFLMFGLSAPVLMKMLPRLIPETGSGGLAIELIGEATLADAAGQYVGFISQMGIILAIVFTMGALAGDRSGRIASMILVKPVSRSSYLLSKFIVSGAVFAVALTAGTAAFYGYSTVIFGGYSPRVIPLSVLCTSLFIIHVLALTMLFSTIARSAAAAGGLALLAVFATSVVPGFFGRAGRYGPGFLLDTAVSILSGATSLSGAAPSLAVTSVLTAAALSTAAAVFSGRDIQP